MNEEIEQLLSRAGEHLNNQTKILQDSISAYSDTLEQSYELIEKKYDENVERIKKDNELNIFQRMSNATNEIQTVYKNLDAKKARSDRKEAAQRPSKTKHK